MADEGAEAIAKAAKIAKKAADDAQAARDRQRRDGNR